MKKIDKTLSAFIVSYSVIIFSVVALFFFNCSSHEPANVMVVEILVPTSAVIEGDFPNIIEELDSVSLVASYDPINDLHALVEEEVDLLAAQFGL